MKVIVSLLILLFSFSPLALEVDAKFIARLLGLSDSKRTILINKGSEVGLKVGDHAKMSLPTGVIARAVVVKLSPSRSVWSVYRFFHKDKLVSKIAVSFKISSAIKLTSDESKSLGLLADKVDKKTDEILDDEKVEFKKKQKTIRNQLIKSENIISQFDNRDYSSLEDDGVVKPLNKDIDWSGLDGKKDTESFDTALDYSRLK